MAWDRNDDGGEESAIPTIVKPEIHLDYFRGLLRCAERGTNPADCRSGGIPLLQRCGAFERDRDLSQFLTKF
jgi:hypothetical protein